MEVKSVKVNDLILWSLNPRNMQEISDEKEIIKALYTKDNTTAEKQYILAKDILLNGLVLADLPIAVPLDSQSNKYTVYEGNRRIAVIKSIINPSLLDFDTRIMNKFIKLQQENGDSLKKLSEINVLIADKKNALRQIDKLHNTKGKKGISRETWGSKEQDYFDNVVDEKENTKPKKPAYYITTKYKDKFDHYLKDELQYTSIDRLLNFSLFKDISGIKNFEELSDKQIELIQYYFDKALYVEKTENIRISRFKVATIRKYIESDLREKYNEILTRDDTISIEVDNLIEINCSEQLNIKPVIKNRKTGEVLSEPEYTVVFFDERGDSISRIDTSRVGKYIYEVKYNNIIKRGNIIISRPKNPDIKLNNYTQELVFGQTYNLRENISKQSKNLNPDLVEIRSSNKGKIADIINDVFTEKNSLGDYIIEYYYKDRVTNTPTQQKLKIIVKPEERTIFNIGQKAVFSDSEVFKLYVNNTVSDLIDQANKVDFDLYYYLVAASFRPIIELLIIQYIKRKNLILQKGLLENLSYVITDIQDIFGKKDNIATQLFSQHQIPYEKYKSFVTDLDNNRIKALYDRLNFYAHTGGTMIDKDSILDFSRTTITHLVILISVFLQ